MTLTIIFLFILPSALGNSPSLKYRFFNYFITICHLTLPIKLNGYRWGMLSTYSRVELQKSVPENRLHCLV